MASFRDTASLLEKASDARAAFIRNRKAQNVSIIHFDGDNSFPECKQCGQCCSLNVIAMTREEVLRIHNYILENDVHPIDRGTTRCCLQAEDGSCMVWQVRSQTCKLHHCKVARIDLLRKNPNIRVHDDSELYLVDMHAHFICGDSEVHEC
ncbi:YkgJ family cysteine cluster protein [Adlercreutzia sp. ZJ304]|uniref:YkgJ family cysteine cluster protein n=1 Tax=Adlercreutzia sp. ZJ304 TaxID=2709791 RepID=UPI0013E9BE71|nr:YkgJ family cysteine cluster protein [Adlercreutzia sp. ZJ304]